MVLEGWFDEFRLLEFDFWVLEVNPEPRGVNIRFLQINLVPLSVDLGALGVKFEPMRVDFGTLRVEFRFSEKI